MSLLPGIKSSQVLCFITEVCLRSQSRVSNSVSSTSLKDSTPAAAKKNGNV